MNANSMEVYQDYVVYHSCPRDVMMGLINTRVSFAGGWFRRNDMEDNFKKNSVQMDAEVMCIETPVISLQEKQIKGVLWIWAYQDRIEVFNITPLFGNHLTPFEYNFILSFFNGEIIEKIGQSYGIKVHMSKPYFDMEDCIGREGLNALEFFSRTSNRSTGRSHPSDFKKWARFILIVFRQKKKLPADRLREWLNADGWSYEMSSSLALDFEYAINLLKENETY